jgi:predicted HAD superfamily Cof-like phosphohydrolase
MINFTVMEKAILQVLQFEEAIGANLPSFPAMLDNNQADLRQRLLEEEVQELAEATTLESVADAICDILYITYGTAHEYGMADRLTMLFDEVHASNMTKFPDGKAIFREDGKVMKPDSFREPNLKLILNRRFHLLKKDDEVDIELSDQIAAINKAHQDIWEKRIDDEIMKHLSWFNRLRFKMISRIEKKIKKKVNVIVGIDGSYNDTVTVESKFATTTITNEIG